ncbi:MAG TPA: zeta toxin family protein [Gammaproteobacteria bacterium]|nr:zeta toxin family protein [Gammaproteobacteria bacterium]
MADSPPCIGVLAGTNGAGKSSIAGAFVRRAGGDYFNADEATRRIRDDHPGISEGMANSLAWREGLARLQAAIRKRHDYWFETTLGGRTVTATLDTALNAGLDVRIWYIGLDSPEYHIARVAARVRHGGHAIPADKIRERYDASRRNLIRLMPRLTELKVFDNSFEADPATGKQPAPQLILHLKHGVILSLIHLQKIPEWAKPIAAEALLISR